MEIHHRIDFKFVVEGDTLHATVPPAKWKRAWPAYIWWLGSCEGTLKRTQAEDSAALPTCMKQTIPE